MNDKIPDEVINYCIDNKLTIVNGFKSLIEEKFDVVDKALKALTIDVANATLTKESTPLKPITQKDRDDIESFLKFLDDQQPSTDEEEQK